MMKMSVSEIYRNGLRGFPQIVLRTYLFIDAMWQPVAALRLFFSSTEPPLKSFQCEFDSSPLVELKSSTNSSAFIIKSWLSALSLLIIQSWGIVDCYVLPDLFYS